LWDSHPDVKKYPISSLEGIIKAMTRRLPPLKTLRAFEAAGRLLSFTRAADELNVTQAAVSHQIRLLEENLEVRLFRRVNRAVVLSQAGQGYFTAVRNALDALAAATARLLDQETMGVLTINTLPSFAAKWLVHRLSGFQDAHPDIDVRVSANDRPFEFTREDVDLAIGFGRGEWPGLYIERIFSDEITPVCSPTLLEGPHPLRVPGDLARHTLLHDDQALGDSVADWATWLEAAGVQTVNSARGPRFSHSHMALQAAIDGHGVALGQGVLIADDVAAGRLAKPFPIALPATFAYYAACPMGTQDRPKIHAFRTWLKTEATF
jgi:LysR family transcriptional regulator, glycine cleavage system transcriptional activator